MSSHTVPIDPEALTFRPLTPDTFDDLGTVMAQPGCSLARGCWCTAYRYSGRPPLDPGLPTREGARALLSAAVEQGRFVGLLASDETGRPVGWCSFGPREDFPVLARSPVMKPVDDVAVWSIVCFVIPGPLRKQGIAEALLRAAQAEVARRGEVLEAYPVDPSPGARASDLWFGTTSMFRRAGFVEVARRRPSRPIMRWAPATRA